jgi:geranylgeranyl pyrophosphate synthase
MEIRSHGRGKGRGGIFRFLPLVEWELNRRFPAADVSPLNQFSRHALFPGGKRIRPLLCIAAYDACRPTNRKSLETPITADERKSRSGIGAYQRVSAVSPEILPIACGIELLHTFSLVQDDLPMMDNDCERRGKPTLHVAFGEAPALLASDALFADAFELFSARAGKISPSRRIKVIAEVARAIGKDGIVAGQLQDITPKQIQNPKSKIQNPWSDCVNPKTLRRTHCLKTARLIAVSLKAGGIAAGARPSVISGLERAGIFLGMLFQITDDLLDMGKGSGIRDQGSEVGPPTPDPRPPIPSPGTYPALYGRAGARFRAQRYCMLYEAELERVKIHLSPTGFRDLRAMGELVLKRAK